MKNSNSSKTLPIKVRNLIANDFSQYLFLLGEFKTLLKIPDFTKEYIQSITVNKDKTHTGLKDLKVKKSEPKLFRRDTKAINITIMTALAQFKYSISIMWADKIIKILAPPTKKYSC